MDSKNVVSMGIADDDSPKSHRDQLFVDQLTVTASEWQILKQARSESVGNIEACPSSSKKVHCNPTDWEDPKYSIICVKAYFSHPTTISFWRKKTRNLIGPRLARCRQTLWFLEDVGTSMNTFMETTLLYIRPCLNKRYTPNKNILLSSLNSQVAQIRLNQLWNVVTNRVILSGEGRSIVRVDCSATKYS